MSKPKKRRMFQFTPEQEKLFNLVTVPGTNTNSNVTVGENAKRTGVQTLNFLAQEAARKDAEVEARSDRKTVKRLTTVGERLRGDNGYSSYMSAGTPMSGRDPALGTIFDWTVGAKGIDALGKTALWNYAKYVPTSGLGRWGRNYFTNQALKEGIKDFGRNLSNRLYIENAGKYTLFNQFGDDIGTLLTTEPLTSEAKGKGIAMVASKNGGHKVSEDLYNIAVLDSKELGYQGLESGHDLFRPNLTMHVTDKFPKVERPNVSLLYIDGKYLFAPSSTQPPIRLLIGTTERPQPNFIQELTNHRIDLGALRNLERIKFNEATGNFEEIPMVSAPEPSTSLKFFERKPSRISFAERLGIPKGDRGNLNLFLKDALEDLEQYINSGLYRQLPTINMETAEPSWVSSNGNVSALRLLIDDGVPSSGRLSWAWNRPNGGTYELVTDGNGNFGIGYNSYRMFDISPEFNARVGEASAGSARHGYSKIFLTAPRNDVRHFITETPEQELAKKTLIETQSPRISKDIMRDFWSGVQLSLRPGAYLSGDEGMLPKGATLIRLFKELSKKGYKRDNNGNIIGSGRTTWEDIRNLLMRPEKWKKREDGLSTDSYLALLKLASRENSPYYLRYSPDGFTTFNNQSIDNKFISDLLEKTKTGEATQLEFLDAFHNWVSPYGGMDARIINGEIVIPHPFLYKKKQGGKLTINNTDI